MEYYNDLPEDLENCEIVVGIPSFNNAQTIAHVAKVAAEGITNLGLKGLIANSDGGSTDGTIERFLSVQTEPVRKFSIRYKGFSGKGSAVRALFEIAHRVKAKVFIMLDSDLRSVEPWWIERLAKPILDGKTQYIAPLYLRHKYDGTITNNICYPLTCALYGVKVRQPIGGDFGVGRELFEVYLEKPASVWQTNVAKFGIDIWMSTIAINESSKRPMQAALGAKVHDVKDPGKHLQGMFIQVVQTLFDLMIEYESRWKAVEELTATEVYGEQPTQHVEEIVVDLKALKERAKNELKEKAEDLHFVSKQIVEGVINTGTIQPIDWVETVYSAALEYKKTRKEETVLKLLPFYFARVADFVEKTKDMSSEEAERLIEEQLELFRDRKKEFLKRWFG
ncbi:glycosyltransferase family 2 protein [Pseudothermotoga sp. U03pept]|uniref:glycosyltransferase family 2 protein n=1 Tax=Pseudothermotoga sp. U03pept TaxID=3447012 RepID=UPI003F05905C